MDARAALRRSSLLALLLITSAGLAGSGGQQRPTFRSGIEVVAIDVNVVDRAARPIADLRPEDFRVTVDGRPRAIVSAQFIRYEVTLAASPAAAPAAPTATPAPVPPPPPRNVLIVIDEDSVEAGDGLVVKRAARTFLDRFGPNDRFGVVTIPRLRREITFTRDRDEVRKALDAVIVGSERFRPDPFRIGLAEAFDVERGDTDTLKKIQARECCTDNRAEWPCREKYAGCGRDVQLMVRDLQLQTHMRGLRSLEALRDLGRTLAQVAGPKTMLFISGGIPSPDIKSAYSYTEIEAAFAEGQVTLYTLYVEPAQFGRAQNVISPTAAADLWAEREGAENTTSVTGGTWLEGIGTLEPYFDRVAAELSGSYLLGIEVEPADRNGKPHAVKVTVNRKGLEVRARKQYVIERSATPAASDAPKPGRGRTHRRDSQAVGSPGRPRAHARRPRPGHRARRGLRSGLRTAGGRRRGH